MPVKIAVCDNDRETRRYLAAEISRHKPEAWVKAFASADELLQTEENFAIYFLDIKGISGLEVARRLRQQPERSIIIFVTGYRDYMEEAFDVHAFQYLLKPLDSQKLAQVLEQAWQELDYKREQAEKFVLLKDSQGTQKVWLKDIFYIESGNKKVIVHTLGGTYAVQGRMESFEQACDLYRCHRCYLVNFAHIAAYSQNEIKMTNGDKILLAYKKYPAFVKAYMRYARKGGVVNV